MFFFLYTNTRCTIIAMPAVISVYSLCGIREHVSLLIIIWQACMDIQGSYIFIKHNNLGLSMALKAQNVRFHGLVHTLQRGSGGNKYVVL